MRSLVQFAAKSVPAGVEVAMPADGAGDRALTLLADGAMRQMGQLNAAEFESFCGRVGALARKMPDHLPEAEKIMHVRSVLKEFENYRAGEDALLHERLSGWRALVLTLFTELFAALGVDASSKSAASISDVIRHMNTAEEIAQLSARIEAFLHPGGSERKNDVDPAHLRKADRTTANDNAAGLRGGGAAVDHVQRMIDKGDKGLVAIFHLNVLDVISERFGMEAVQDCIMAVSAHLTHSLRKGDAIYHWSDASLLGVLEKRANSRIAMAELQRIASQNREITITVGGRAVMLRIPIEFELIELDQLESAEALNWVTSFQAVGI
ncbi:MAG: diguanylate cyclase [Acidobacteriota bacterium]|nr:diguanylate cyclase [Acidobacteriota bacterium]